MIVRVFILIALLLFVYWCLNSVAGKFTLNKQQSRLLLILGVVLTVIIVLIVMGRLPFQFILAPIGVALTFLLRMLPTALRLMPLWHMLKTKTNLHRNKAGKSQNQSSVIRTEFLSMELQHSSGDMDGSVLKGKFEGQRLSLLPLEQLIQLAQECHADQDSIQVLEAYLDRMHSQWRDNYQREKAPDLPIEESVMTRDLALEILGLADPASWDDVTLAHRKLMQKMHPDRGGTDYLAKKINAAKDYLENHV